MALTDLIARRAQARPRPFGPASLTRNPLVAIAVVALGVGVLGAVFLDAMDLDVYRFAGRAVLEGARLYGEHPGLPFTYPPFAAVLLVPTALLPHVVAVGAWTAIGVAALGVTMLVFLREEGFEPSAGQLAGLVLLALLVDPVRMHLHFGQVNLLLMCAISYDLLVLRGRWSGILVGVAAGIKLTPVVFIALLVLVGRRAAAARATAAFVATVLLSAALMPASAASYWTRAAWDPARVGGTEYIRNQSILGTLTRLLGAEPSTILWLAVVVPISAAVLVVAAMVWRRGLRGAGVCLAAGAMLLASPISWDHHWVWMVPAVIVLARLAHPLVTSAIAVLMLTGVRVWVPHGERQELDWAWHDQILGNGYVWAVLLLVVGAALRVCRGWPHSASATGTGLSPGPVRSVR